MHVAEHLLARGNEVVGIDNFNDYYDVSLKQARLARLAPQPNFRLAKLDIADRSDMADLFEREKPGCVVHLAAQASVRYSLKNPYAYADSNLVGFVNVLEGCRQAQVEHLVYASSSSVYGGNVKTPFSEHDSIDHPISLYAATKRANELLAHSYSHLYGLPTTGLRFFTVYGPWGRPDMAYFMFTKAILEGRPIDVFNHGRMQRDFTYIDDITEGVVRVLDQPATPDPAYDPLHPDPASSNVPYRLFNIGNHQPVELMEFIATLENALGKKALKNFLPQQAGDVQATSSDMTELHAATGFAPSTSIKEGVDKFIDWYKNYYAVNTN